MTLQNRYKFIKDMPKLSIIIPIYNVEKFINKCVQSAMNQTLEDIEIILVDDESPDSCPQMCDGYAKKDSRIKVVHKKNGGLGFARNSGLDVATGEYVTFLDSDDFVDLCTYEHLYNIAKTGNLDVLYYKFKRFTNESDVTPVTPVNEIKEYDIEDLKLDIIASEPSAKVDHKIHCSSCTAMYRLNIIKDNNVRFHSERELISEDLIFNLDFLKHANKAAFNSGEHYHYRMNPTSLTSAVRTDRIEKNVALYNYIKDNIVFWGLNYEKGYERVCRFFIGSSRMAISLYLNSKKSTNKHNWLYEQISKPIWKKIFTVYDWQALPYYQRLFFYSCATKKILLIKMLCILKSITR